MTSVLGRSRHVTDSGKAVKYTPCNKGDQTDEEELEEIAVVQSERKQNHGGAILGGESAGSGDKVGAAGVSNSAVELQQSSETLESDDQGSSVTANGPRALPGGGPQYQGGSSDRTKLIGERLAGSCSRIGMVSSPVYSGKSVEQRRGRSTSRASLFEVVQNRIEQVKGGSKKVRDLSHASVVNKAYNPEPMTPKEIRKQRRKEINDKFGKKPQFSQLETSTSSSDKDGCRWTFVFDPSGRLAYWWSFVVSIAFLYNFWVIIYRFAFEEINKDNMYIWFTLDYLADLLYVLDIAFHFRTGYLEDGVLQTDSVRLRIHYMNSTMFYIDGLCLLPLDFLYLSIGFKSMLRCFRLIKIYRFWAFLDRTERHTNYPNVVRTITLLHYLFCIYHWNACVMYIVTRQLNDNQSWLFPGDVLHSIDSDRKSTDVFLEYLHALHWSTLTLTTIGELPRPKTRGEYLFVIFEFVMALLLFSSVLGHVANIVTSISLARRTFQANLDSVKTYMLLRRVPLRLQDRVIKWFDYLWLSKKTSNEEHTMALLPDKLKAEIALHVHLDTLKRVEIFQNTEAGFLCELVLKLRPVLFSPGDYICRKGEIGKEMYIVSRGKLQVVADNGKTILATLRPGSYFGEISILNMGNAGNRRTASVRSVGYSDLFVLSKKDLWDVLLDYPTARVRLEAIAMKRLEKYKKAPLDEDAEEAKKAALPRSKSTPGLVESTGKVPLETMFISRHNTLPAGVGSRQASEEGSHTASHRSDSRAANSSQSSSQHSSRTGGRVQTESDNVLKNASNGADLTNSMTVSSITSYITDTSAQKSPLVAPSSSQPDSPFNQPHQPVLVAPSAFRPIETGSRPIGYPILQNTGMPGATVSTATISVTTSTGILAAANQTGLPAAFDHRTMSSHTMVVSSNLLSPSLSPPAIMSGYQTHPPPHSRANTSSSAGLLLAGPSLHPSSRSLYHVGANTPNQLVGPTSGSVGSLSRDPSHEILLQEITRLRARLQTLETENASMSFKLNQQQWEVEHRLSEIEMHICGSDSVDSEEKSSIQGNKESII